MDYVIETEKLTKVYKGGVVAVNEVDFKVPRGVVAGLLGHNGAGKTTLISMLVGLILPTKGKGRVLGHDIVRESKKIREKVGLLPEGFGFYEHLTAWQNLEYLAKLNGLTGQKAKERISRVLEDVGLANFKNLKVGAFSRGMKQRLGIAQALLKDPEILILDEPTVGIDPEGSIGFRKLIKRLAGEGRTIVISTHLLHEMADVCNYLTIMRRGKVVAQGYVEELRHDFMSKRGYTYVIELEKGVEDFAELVSGLAGVVNIETEHNIVKVYAKADITHELNRVLKEGDFIFREFRCIKPSLERLFLFYHGGE